MRLKTGWCTERTAGCAGAYVYGVGGSNSCPATSARIVDATACEAAAASAGKPWGGSQAVSTTPRGCYLVTSSNYVWFNTHTAGAGSSTARLLCATIGMPLELTFLRKALKLIRMTRHGTQPIAPSKWDLQLERAVVRRTMKYYYTLLIGTHRVLRELAGLVII
jgi:hypothetical protein